LLDDDEAFSGIAYGEMLARFSLNVLLPDPALALEY